MKTIAEELELIPGSAAVGKRTVSKKYAERATALGFAAIQEKAKTAEPGPLPYPEITEQAINRLLTKRIIELQREREQEKLWGYWNEAKKEYHTSSNGVYLAWIETPIEKYDKLPPEHVLTSLEKAKAANIFESFVIVTVQEIKDPLLVGITADKRRGLIDSWDNDLTAEEVTDLIV